MLRRARRGLIACALAAGCAGPREPTRPTPQQRCVLRISRRGTFADGEPMSRTAAVAYCRRAPRGAEIVIEDELAWNDVRSSLEREGVHFSVRRICDPCRRSFPAGPIQPKREIQPTRDTR